MMLKPLTILLVVVTAERGCKLDNVDRSTHSVVVIQNMETCEAMAAQLDAAIAQRAFCIEQEESS